MIQKILSLFGISRTPKSLDAGAYKAGYEGFGKNPYPKGTAQHDSWKKGNAAALNDQAYVW